MCLEPHKLKHRSAAERYVARIPIRAAPPYLAVGAGISDDGVLEIGGIACSGRDRFCLPGAEEKTLALHAADFADRLGG
ncbi:MAG: hypothetical protein LDL33_15630 [Desulfomonile sp.]|nr:hypothetical protein [Desulfomonile sp.]